MLQSDLETAIDVKTESSTVDYKSAFDVDSAADWLEVVKDVIAMSNSGGGVIIIGVTDECNLSDFDCSVLNALDPATMTDKIYRYTGKQFDGFRFMTATRQQRPLFAIAVSLTEVPIVFSKPGTYDIGGGRQKTAFSAGTVYFRHGAKSEPGNSDDLRTFLEGRIEQMRKAWFEGIVKVVEAPPGSEVQVTPPQQVGNQSANIRLVNDPTAPAYRALSIDETHPHRQKEVIEEFNKASGGAKKITSFHVQCVRHVHRIDENPTFYSRIKHASPRYSQAFVDWLVHQYNQSPDFFEDAKRRGRGGA